MKIEHLMLLTGPIQYLTLLHTSVIKHIWIKMKKLLRDLVARMWLWQLVALGWYASTGVKNPILIYENVSGPTILKYGLWNQLRIDHGPEFSLCIFVHDILKNYRQSTEKKPWKRTTSTQNNVIERFWPKLNS